MSTTFTRSVREELARRTEERGCCRLAEVAALVRTCGTFHIRGGDTDQERYELQLATTVQSAARLVYSHFKSFGAEGLLLTHREPRFRHRLVYEAHFPGTPAVLQALNELGILSDKFRLDAGVNPRLVKRGCCRSAFVRGCVIGAGHVNAPQKDTHLEFVLPHQRFARDLADLLESLDFRPGLTVRRGTYVVYLKGREEVAGLLAVAGAPDAALELQEQAVLKDVRARANRLANCDSANLRRTTEASANQLEAIALLDRTDALRRLPPALREVADLRREHPYMTLSEMVEETQGELTRSAINHRLRRLMEAAERLSSR